MNDAESRKLYVVMTEENDDGDITTEILNWTYYSDRDDARRAMIEDFDLEKGEFDNCDDTDESHSLDRCSLSANMVWSKEWNVVDIDPAK